MIFIFWYKETIGIAHFEKPAQGDVATCSGNAREPIGGAGDAINGKQGLAILRSGSSSKTRGKARPLGGPGAVAKGTNPSGGHCPDERGEAEGKVYRGEEVALYQADEVVPQEQAPLDEILGNTHELSTAAGKEGLVHEDAQALLKQRLGGLGAIE